MPSRPPLVPLEFEVTWLLLEASNAHQAAFRETIRPEVEVNRLSLLGTSNYILELVEDVETALNLSPESTLTPQQRVERIQARSNLRQYERPKPTTSKALTEPQSSHKPSTNSKNRGLDELPTDVLFLVSRVLGHQCYKLPPDMSGEDAYISSLILHYLKAKDTLEFRCLYTHDSITSEKPDQLSAPEA
ncbi:hypothetical protein CEP54_015288 [Fusarium duplospermum]|uniref:Uncharacterized protein n=1 Tax=Fusarium duplospermum TaxID=1325734 RepID=A0A428NQ98_9HYPO|nr:hypothetical protein CEP54_015288 [Fusarium duplospermum]